MSGHLANVLVTLGRWYVRYAPGLLGKASLAADFLNPYLRDNPRVRVARSRFGARFEVDTRDLIQQYVYLFGVWEPHLTAWLQRRLNPGDTFIDVGANVGYVSVLAAQLVGENGQVVSVEASPEFCQRVQRHALLNGLRNIRAVNAAVSDKHERMRFFLASSANLGATTIVPQQGPVESSFEIHAAPLLELISPEELASARVIKIDVEGAEGAVMRGLLPALDKLRPDAEIIVEVDPNRMAALGYSVAELLDAMAGHGFHIYRLTNNEWPESYPMAARGASGIPARWREPIRQRSDLVFSRVDAETLP
jgi:FkbM family methyltransferase